MTPFFLPYQVRWIRDDARIKIMEKSRQIGLSWSTAYRALRNAAVHPRTHIWICSRDLQQAQLFLNDCKAFASVLNQAYKEKLIGKQSEQRTILRLNNGSTLTLISSNINAQAGKRGSRILDEFALHEDPEALYNVAYPGITWGGQLEMISTHRGAHNFFNRLIEEARNGGNPKGISLHRVTLSDALEQGFLRKLKAKLPPDDPRQAMDEGDYYNFIKNSCATEKAFLQEYMCQPMEDASTLLSYEALERCFYDKNCDWRSWTNGTVLMGVDLARTQDLSAFVSKAPSFFVMCSVLKTRVSTNRNLSLRNCFAILMFNASASIKPASGGNFWNARRCVSALPSKACNSRKTPRKRSPTI